MCRNHDPYRETRSLAVFAICLGGIALCCAVLALVRLL